MHINIFLPVFCKSLLLMPKFLHLQNESTKNNLAYKTIGAPSLKNEYYFQFLPRTPNYNYHKLFPLQYYFLDKIMTSKIKV